MSFSLRRTLGSLALLLVSLSALAMSDPPARVGRLAYIENEVNFRADRDDQGGPAAINWPISSAAQLDTERRGRAEVWIGSTAYRLAGNSRIEFASIDDQQVALQLIDGSLAVSILDRDQADDITVSTPEGRIRFSAAGRYRIDIRSDHTELSVQAGQASINDGARITPVAAGQKASLYPGGQARLEPVFEQDAFDSWVADRENATLAGATRQHVSPYMTGYQDLDAYGDWQSAPEYGTVWYPRAMADDWAPYRYGRWAWVEPWGWTWVDQAPWGFAPFHYGRWAMISHRWAWIPGHHRQRPVYAPALVGWIGNPGWSLNFRSGSAPAVGWFPLAPREVFVPAYRHSSGYVRQLNVSHVTNVNIIDRAERSGPHERFAHQGTPQAVTVVPANLMREGRPIRAPEIFRHDRNELGRAPQAGHAPNADWLPPAANAARPRADLAPRGPVAPAPRQAGPTTNNGHERQGQRFDQPERGGMPESRRDSRPERERSQPAPPIAPAPAPEVVPPSHRIEIPPSTAPRGSAAPDVRQVVPVPNNLRENEGRRFEPPSREVMPEPRRDSRPERERSQPVQPVAPAPEVAPPSRRIEIPPSAAPRGPAAPDVRQVMPAPNNLRENEGRRFEPPSREVMPEPRRDSRPDRERSPLPAPELASPPSRRIEIIQPAPPPVRQEMQPPRQIVPIMPPERESRHETQRIEPPAFRQREMPPPAPVIRMPPPQAAPQPPPQPMPVPRAEPPRPPEQRGGDRDNRHHGDEHGERGPH